MEAKMVVKINYKFLIVLITLCFLVNLVYAQNSPSSSLKLFSEKSVYTPGETILIYAEINNIREQTVLVNLENFLNNEKENYPIAVIPLEFVLKPNETKKIVLYDILIDENMISDFYTVKVDLAFNSERITKKSLQFEIIDTLKEIVLDVNVCKDSACETESKIFIKNEDIYLDYSSEVENPSIIATLTYPSGKSESVEIPSILELDEIGTYIINVQVSKSGYKIMQVSKQIGIIEQEADIKGKSPSIEVTEAKGSRLWFWIIVAIFVLTVAFFIYMKIRGNYLLR